MFGVDMEEDEHVCLRNLTGGCWDNKDFSEHSSMFGVDMEEDEHVCLRNPTGGCWSREYQVIHQR
jgi:hypothetical protein